jgi:hypothetical protein
MKLLNLFIFLFLFSNIEVASSSSCKELQDMVYNLDINCGGRKFHLFCDGNNAIFYMQSTKILVKDISFQNKTFRLVDYSYSATGDLCHLPNQNVSWVDNPLFDLYYYYSNSSLIHFVNCTQEIENSKYKLIPCLTRTNSRVYAVPVRYSLMFYVSGLHDSCRPVGHTIIDTPDESFDQVDDGAIMQAIRKGVLVNWTAHHESYWQSCSHLAKCWRSSIL